jgi:hypothetical protein
MELSSNLVRVASIAIESRRMFAAKVIVIDFFVFEKTKFVIAEVQNL